MHLCNLGVRWYSWYKLLVLQDTTPHLSPVLPFNSLWSFFSHNSPLTNCEIQPALTTLSVIFVSFSHCYLSCPAISHVTSNCFPHPLQSWESATNMAEDNAGTGVWIAIGYAVSHQTVGSMKGPLTQNSRFSFHFLQTAGSPPTLPSQCRNCLPRTRNISHMGRVQHVEVTPFGESGRASSVLKEVEKWTPTLET